MYAYYLGNGFYGVVISRIVNLLIIGFLVAFSIFLVYAVDWSFVRHQATAIRHPTLYSVIHMSGILRYVLSLLCIYK